MTVSCYWCDAKRHRTDMLVVDDKLMCHRDLSPCIEEYIDSTQPGKPVDNRQTNMFNVDRAQVRALGTTAY